ncbi:MAG: tetratricopeptide repeat protein [Pseudanabaena sp. CAN_BIN31]|nr:tetratricopeptide repeat protein [Pseudanabaena sp. CAN_BIN31]
MLSPEPSPLSNLPDRHADLAALLEHNQEVFQFLLAFVQMSKGFKVGFIEVNFPPDVDLLMMALREHPKCAGMQFAVLRFTDPDLRFLLEAIKEELPKIEIQPDKKLVLVLQGLEKAIAYSGDNPPILTNLNYARDSFPVAIPHPLLFALPDYAVTRLAQFAPDFWAWTSSTFKFETLPETRDRLTSQASSYSHDPNRSFAKPERSDRIDLLERLLQEYPEDTEASSRTRLELLNQLGKSHQSIREFEKAKFYFQQAIDLSRESNYKREEASNLFALGDIYLDIREYGQSKKYLDQCLKIEEEIGDRYSQASTYHQLGIVAEKLREYEEARENYQQALAIYIECDDRYSQASTYHQLGIVAQDLQEYEEARQNYQQALAINVEFGDHFSQGSTYGQLGLLAAAEGNLTESRQNLLQALEIFAQFQDQHSVDLTLRNLSRIYQTTQDANLLESISQVFGISVDQARQQLESS